MHTDVQCPSCGEWVSVWVDLDGGTSQRYVEDCSVCCRPMEVIMLIDRDGGFSLSVRAIDA